VAPRAGRNTSQVSGEDDTQGAETAYRLIRISTDGLIDGAVEPATREKVQRELETERAPEHSSLLLVIGIQSSGGSRDEYEGLIPEGKPWDLTTVESRTAVTPRLVPAGWEAPTGVHGVVVGPFRRGPRRKGMTDPPLVLVLWRTEPENLDSIAHVIAARLTSFRVDRPWRVVALIDGLVDGRSVRSLKAQPSAEEEAPAASDIEEVGRSLEEVVSKVDDWERAFRGSQDFSSDDHDDLERTMKDLARWKIARLPDNLEIERVGLEARVVRLLDAQASRDAAGALERVVGALTALVLVPTLVAGVYGANVSVPLAGTSEGWRAMLGFMAAGAALTYVAMSGTQLDGQTRRLVFRLPGGPQQNDDSNRNWLVRLSLAGLCGIAIGVVITAIRSLGEVFDQTTSFWTLVVLGALLALVVVGMAGNDFAQRGRWNSALDVVAAVSCAAVAATSLDWELWWLGMGGLAMLATVVTGYLAHDALTAQICSWGNALAAKVPVELSPPAGWPGKASRSPRRRSAT
jgi:hypothetical protein